MLLGQQYVGKRPNLNVSKKRPLCPRWSWWNPPRTVSGTGVRICSKSEKIQSWWDPSRTASGTGVRNKDGTETYNSNVAFVKNINFALFQISTFYVPTTVYTISSAVWILYTLNYSLSTELLSVHRSARWKDGFHDFFCTLWFLRFLHF